MNGSSAPCSSFILHRSSLFVSFPHNPRAQRIQSLLDFLVAAIDLMDVVDDAFALGAECGEEQRHACTDVGTGDVRGDKSITADDDGSMRIAEDDSRSHGDEFVREEEA